MSAIVLDASKVNSYVLPSLNKSENLMQTSYSTSVSLKNSLPSSFNQRSAVNEIVNQIYNIKKEINDIEGIIDSKLASAKRIESKSESRVSSIASAASKIGSVVGAIGGAALGARTGGVVGAAAGAVVGNQLGKNIGKNIIETGAKVVGKFTSICKNIGNSIKDLWNAGAKVVKKVASFKSKVIKSLGNFVGKIIDVAVKVPQFVINTRAKIVKGAASVVESIFGVDLTWVKTGVDKISSFCNSVIGKAGNLVSGLVKGIANYLGDFLTNPILTLKRTAATVVNVFLSVLEGLTSFVEAIVDAAVVIVGGLVGSVGGMIVDLCQGIFKGEWDWSATGAVWKKGLLPFVGRNWTDELIFRHHSGSAIDNLAYDWAKRDGGIVYEIGKGVGYYTGVIVATALTGGGASVGMLATGLVAGTAELGKATQSNYNSSIDKLTKKYYIEEIMKNNPEFTKEDAEEYFNYILENNLITNYDEIRKLQQDNISGGEIAKIISTSGAQAVIEGVTVAVLRAKYPADAPGTMAKKIAEGVQNKALKGFGKAGVQFLKSYAKEGTTVIVDGNYDFEKATIDGTAAAITEVINANYGLKWMKNTKPYSKVSELVTNKVEWLKNTKLVSSASTLMSNLKSKFSNINILNKGTSIKYGFNSEGTETMTERLFEAIKIGKEKIGEKFVKDAYKNILKDTAKEVVSAVVN